MAVIALSSAHGAPGVTTTAFGLALAWPKPVLLVDADPSGTNSIPAGWMRGNPLPTRSSLLDLTLSSLNNTLLQDLENTYTALPGTADTMRFLAGIVSPQQSSVLTSEFWGQLSGALRAVGQRGVDVIVDCGRLGLEHSPGPVRAGADLNLIVSGSRLTDAVAVRSWSQILIGQASSIGAQDRLGLLTVGPRNPYGPSELSKAARIPVMASLPWDPKPAGVLSNGDLGTNLVKTKLFRALTAQAMELSGKASMFASSVSWQTSENN